MRAQISCGLHTAVVTAKELVPYLQSISGTHKFFLISLVTLLGQMGKTDFFLPLLSVHFNGHFCIKYSSSLPFLIGHFVHNQYLQPYQ